MTNSNKQRGNTAERKVAKLLTETFGLPFTRVPNSGALVGGSNSARKNNLDNAQIKLFTGDIIPPEQYHVSIEVKKTKHFSFHLLCFGKYQLFDSWIEQAEVENDNWILIFDIDYTGTFVLVDKIFCQSILVNCTNYFVYKDYIVHEARSFFTNNRRIIDRLWRTKNNL